MVVLVVLYRMSQQAKVDSLVWFRLALSSLSPLSEYGNNPGDTERETERDRERQRETERENCMRLSIEDVDSSEMIHSSSILIRVNDPPLDLLS